MHLLYDRLRETPQGPIAVPPSNHDIIPHKLFSGSDWHARYGVSGESLLGWRLGSRVEPKGDTMGFHCQGGMFCLVSP